jgi:hypothetical protein
MRLSGRAAGCYKPAGFCIVMLAVNRYDVRTHVFTFYPRFLAMHLS